MASFQVKKLESGPSVGEVLKKERERRQLTIDEAAQKLNLAPKYLKILETNSWPKLSGQVYIKTFLRKYAQFLEIDPQKLIDQYFEEKEKYWLLTRAAPNRSKLKLNLDWLKISRVPLLFRKMAMSGLVLVLAAYLTYEVSGVFTSPRLVLESPSDGQLNNSETVLIKGQTEPEAKVQINGKEVLSNSLGLFTADVGLQKGLNIINVSATKKHGGTKTISRRIILENPQP